MPKILKIDKEKCISCGTCVAVCPQGADWDADGKAKVTNSDELEKCGGESLCPYAAIEEVK